MARYTYINSTGFPRLIDLETAMSTTEISNARAETIEIARSLGADEATINTLTDALRVRRSSTIVLPMVRYETLSRGKGWCRCGRGDAAKWGERTDSGYIVGPGKWIVFGSDGFRREERIDWEVEHIQVGEQTWTIAN